MITNNIIYAAGILFYSKSIDQTTYFLLGKDFVSPDDVQAVLHDCFRHRIIVSFEAEATGITPDQVLDTVLQRVAAT